MKISKIYFDMDGVLADFNRGIREMCGIEPVNQSNKKKSDDDRIWEAVKSIEHFYDKLEFMPGTREMFFDIYNKYGDICEILSAIPKPGRGIITAGEDKISWAHRKLTDKLKVNIVYREEKKNYAIGKDCILIDDFQKNILEWEAYGGTGILFSSVPETIKRLKEVEEELAGKD